MNDLTFEIVISVIAHIPTFFFLVETLKKRKFKTILIEFLLLIILCLILFVTVKSKAFIWSFAELIILFIVNIILTVTRNK